MIQKLLTSTGILILGILLLIAGFIPFYKYEQAKASGYEVEATVVEVNIAGTSEIGGETIEQYTVYADYTVNGVTYQHVKLKNYGAKHYVGETVKIVVDPKNPEKLLSEGGIISVVGFLLAGSAIFTKVKKSAAKKRQNSTAQQ